MTEKQSLQTIFFPAMCVVVGVLMIITPGCGDDDGDGAPRITIDADETMLASDEDTMLNITVSDKEEQSVELSTDVGFVGLFSEKSTVWQTSYGMLDVPFSCGGETGTATVEAWWQEQDISCQIQIVCD
ncbi:MAG: hypothetical protein ACQES9_13990 [Myxococcota bacterium]